MKNLLLCLVTASCLVITARPARADNVNLIDHQLKTTKPLPVLVTSNTNTATTVKSSALEASHVLKASAGKLVSLQVFNSSASLQYILIMDSATVPANGAVTLLCPPIPIPAASYFNLTFPLPLSAAAGISVSNSSTASFTKTIGSADCIFTGQVQ